jgi:hypothetical protein
MYTDRDIRIGISAVRGIAKPHINLTQNRKKRKTFTRIHTIHTIRDYG